MVKKKFILLSIVSLFSLTAFSMNKKVEIINAKQLEQMDREHFNTISLAKEKAIKEYKKVKIRDTERGIIFNRLCKNLDLKEIKNAVEKYGLGILIHCKENINVINTVLNAINSIPNKFFLDSNKSCIDFVDANFDKKIYEITKYILELPKACEIFLNCPSVLSDGLDCGDFCKDNTIRSDYTLLSIAVSRGRKEIVEFLLKKGVKVSPNYLEKKIDKKGYRGAPDEFCVFMLIRCMSHADRITYFNRSNPTVNDKKNMMFEIENLKSVASKIILEIKKWVANRKSFIDKLSNSKTIENQFLKKIIDTEITFLNNE